MGPKEWLQFDPSHSGTRRLRAAWVAVLVLGTIVLATYNVLWVRGVRGHALLGLLHAVWVVTVTREGTLAPERLNAPGLAWFRTVYCITMIALAAAIPVGLADTRNPTWVFGVFAGFVLAQTGAHRHPMLVASTALVPAVEVVLVHGWEAERLAIALVAGALASVSLFGCGALHARKVRRDEARLAHDGELAERKEQVAQLATAMALHDGLSGLMLVARTRVADATRVEEALPIVKRLLENAERVLGNTKPTTIDDFAQTVEELRALFEADVTLRVDGAVPLLSRELVASLLDVAHEGAVNALKAGSTKVSIRLSSTRGEVRMEVVANPGDPLRPSSGRGRGLRYTFLRSTLRRGTAGLESTGEGTRLWATWPTRETGVLEVAVLALPFPLMGVALVFLSHAIVSVVAVLLIAAVVAGLGAAERGAQLDRRESRAYLDELARTETHEALVLSRERLGPGIAAVRRAVTERDLEALDAALGTMSRGLSALIRELEGNTAPLRDDAPPVSPDPLTTHG
ncbi:MAG: hypothetical protein U0183_12040 [Polyangiaceae bacterium]